MVYGSCNRSAKSALRAQSPIDISGYYGERSDGAVYSSLASSKSSRAN
jgi:hypothetical protein